MDKQAIPKARSLVVLPGDLEIRIRRTADMDVVEAIVTTADGEARPVRVTVQPAVAA